MNVYKHVRLVAIDVWVCGCVGVGFDVEVSNQVFVVVASLLLGAGFGLVGFVECVLFVGGCFDVGLILDGGWWVCAYLFWFETEESV